MKHQKLRCWHKSTFIMSCCYKWLISSEHATYLHFFVCALNVNNVPEFIKKHQNRACLSKKCQWRILQMSNPTDAPAYTWPVQGCCGWICLSAQTSEDSKCQKVENRRFNENWTDEFAFIFPSHTHFKHQC